MHRSTSRNTMIQLKILTIEREDSGIGNAGVIHLARVYDCDRCSEHNKGLYDGHQCTTALMASSQGTSDRKLCNHGECDWELGESASIEYVVPIAPASAPCDCKLKCTGPMGESACSFASSSIVMPPASTPVAQQVHECYA